MISPCRVANQKLPLEMKSGFTSYYVYEQFMQVAAACTPCDPGYGTLSSAETVVEACAPRLATLRVTSNLQSHDPPDKPAHT